MGRLRVGIFAIVTATALISACQERLVEPSVSTDAVVDSSEMKARVARWNQPGGPMRVGGTLSDTMTLLVDIDSFRIELDSRSCASPTNTVTVVSITTSVLSGTMCQVPEDTVWSFPNAYDADESIVLDFESGAGSGQIRIEGMFPDWTASFEDGADNDFNDFILSVVAFPSDTLPAMSVKADTTQLHPWISEMSFGATGMGGATDTAWTQESRPGDSATVRITAFDGVAADTGATVIIKAELLPGIGGHAHQQDRLGIDSLPVISYAGSSLPVAGHFKVGSTTSDSLVVETDSTGSITFQVVAGFIGGRLDVISSATIGDSAIVDTLELELRVPDLENLSGRATAAANALFVGAVAAHPFDSTWHATDEFADAMTSLAEEMADSAKYLQFNDVSLPYGGSFSLEANLATVAGTNKVDRPYVSHKSHALGVDMDVSTCFGSQAGVSANPSGVQAPPCEDALIPFDDLRAAAEERGLVIIVERRPPHYHFRLRSSVIEKGGS